MADGTVDNLNLQISADSEKAMKSLDSLVDTIGRLKESLKGLRTNNIISISQGADKVAEALKNIENNIGRVSKKKTKITVDTDEIDSAIEKLRKQFSGAGMDFKFSGNTTDFEKAIKKTNAELDRLFEKENKLRDIGVNVDTAGFKGLEYDISRSLNKLDILQNGLDNLRKTLDKPFKIHGTNDDLSLQESDINQNNGRTVEIEDTGYNTEAIQYIEEYAKKLDNLKTKMNITRLSAEDFEAALENLKPPEISGTNLKKLESELERLEQKILDLTNKQENMSKLGTNMDSDGMRKLSQRIVEGSLRADALKDRIEEIKKESAETERPWRKLSSLINNASTGVGKVGKQLSSASPALKKIKNMFSGKKKSDFGMGQMLGTSILFSYVFQALSAIQNAIKEGSDSLTQYSAKYNQSISGITSSLLYLRNAWTAAFSPIINAVAPYVQSFVDMIATAINAVGQFMAALTGKGYVVSAKKIWKDYAASLDDTGNSAGNAADGLGEATKAAEDLKNATLGIDELNIISPNELSSAGGSGGSESSGSGAGGTEISPGDMFETIQVSDSMKNLADMFKEAVASSDFTEIGHLISDKISTSLESIDWDSVYQKARNFGKGLATFLNGLITPRLFGNLGKTIANSINTALQGANAFAINFDWKNLGRSISTGIDKFFENWDSGLTAQTFSNFVSGILEAMTSVLYQ